YASMDLMQKGSHTTHAALLRAANLKATKPRLAVLAALAKVGKPLGVPELQRAHRDFDAVTLYRVLDDLFKAGILRRVDVRHGHADYELAHHHHHHLVCTRCGMIEDIDDCLVDD